MKLIHKFLDTSNLPRSNGKSKRIIWQDCIGKEVYFEYDNIKGIIRILDYKIENNGKSKIKLQYNDNFVTTSPNNLLNLQLIRLFGKEQRKLKYKYSVGDTIKKGNDTMHVLAQTRDNKYHYRAYLLQCSYCNFKYKVTRQNISTCPICGKNTSWGERFVYNILMQADIKFIPQMKFDWLPHFKYDAYLPDFDCIIEIHGNYHYEDTWLSTNQFSTIPKTKEYDKTKYNSAIEHGLKYYIVNASAISDHPNNASNIKSFINEIKLTLTFIEYSNINFDKAELFANYKSIIQECELWNDGKSLEEISDSLCENKRSIQSKLRLGNKYRLCIYDKALNNQHKKIINPNISA